MTLEELNRELAKERERTAIWQKNADNTRADLAAALSEREALLAIVRDAIPFVMELACKEPRQALVSLAASMGAALAKHKEPSK